MATMQLFEALRSLGQDYDELIEVCKKRDKLPFTEKCPQPGKFRKADRMPFTYSDCHMVAEGKTELIGRSELKAKGEKQTGGALLLTYEDEDIVPQYPDKPVKKTPVPPAMPKVTRVMMDGKLYLSGALFLVLIVSALALIVCSFTQSEGASIFFSALFVLSFVAGFVIWFMTKFEFFRVLKKIFRLSAIKKSNQEELEQYQRSLERYLKETKSVETEYDAAVKKYEEAVGAADREAAEARRIRGEAAGGELEPYRKACIDYIARKDAADGTYESDLAVLEARYREISDRICTRTDPIPFKYLSFADFRTARASELGKVREEIGALIAILESGRADDLKEAMNCYTADCQAEAIRRAAEHLCSVEVGKTCAYSGKRECSYLPTGDGGCFNYKKDERRDS